MERSAKKLFVRFRKDGLLAKLQARMYEVAAFANFASKLGSTLNDGALPLLQSIFYLIILLDRGPKVKIER